MSQQTEEMKSALEGLAGDRDTYIHNNAKIQRNAISWISQLLQERVFIVESIKKAIERSRWGDSENAFDDVIDTLKQSLQQIGESDEE